MAGNRRPQSIAIMQANVGTGGAAHEIALNLGFENNYDVVCIQEPYIYRELERKLTKRHPSYETFTPISEWTSRPRVLTYVRKGRGLKAHQHVLKGTWENSADIVAVRINFLTVYNTYRPPAEAITGPIISDFSDNPPEPNSVFLGDLNTHHELWDPDSTRNTGAEHINSWLEQHHLCLISPPGIPTHDEGAVLDVAFSNVEGALGFVKEHLHTTSDHQTLGLYIPDQNQSEDTSPKGRFRYDAIHQETFLWTVRTHLEATPPNRTSTSRQRPLPRSYRQQFKLLPRGHG